MVSKPMSEATLTTNRLVDVPMVVVMPPSKVAKPIGIKMREGDDFVRIATFNKMGKSKTTIGVLFTTALNKAETIRVLNTDNVGLNAQSFAKARPTGSNAPVRTMP